MLGGARRNIGANMSVAYIYRVARETPDDRIISFADWKAMVVKVVEAHQYYSNHQYYSSTL